MIKKTNTKHKTRAGSRSVKQMDRDALLDKLGSMLTEMYTKIMTGRVKDKTVFTAKVSALRAYSYGISIYGSVLKDRDLDRISARLDALEHPREDSDV